MPSILSYYEEEIKALKKTSRLFSDQYPEVSHRIGLEDFEDPHIKRLVESFAFLTARVNLRADEKYPELVHELLSVVAPNFLRPFPSHAIAQFQNVQSPSFIPRHTPLFFNQENLCKFYTIYPINLSPVILKNVDVVSTHDYKIETDWQNRFVKWPSFFLRLSLFGECHDLTFYLKHFGDIKNLYHYVFFHQNAFISRDQNTAYLLPKEKFHHLGFKRKESAILSKGSHQHALLQEYFCFPEKFMFATLQDIHEKGFFEILIPIKEKIHLKTEDILINCTPVINLFPHTLEPLYLTQKKTFFPLIPQINSNMDIYSIEKVELFCNAQKIEIPSIEETSKDYFWSMKYSDQDPLIRINHWDEEGVLHISALCTNKDEPQKIPIYSSLEIELAVKASVCLVKKPTLSHYRDLDNKLLWHILKALTTNEHDIEKILPLYRCTDFVKAHTKDKIRRFHKEAWRGFIQGKEVTLDTNSFLLGKVIEHYFNLVSDVHSFIDTKINVIV